MVTRALLLLREAPPWTLAGAAAAVALLWLVASTLEWAWWSPRRLDRALRAQGLKGTRYSLFTGDLRENARLNREARAKPLPLRCHDIIPRVLPMLHKAVNENGCSPTYGVHNSNAGTVSFTWFGPTPRVMIPDPESVREVLSNKFGHFGKQQFSRASKLLGNGLANHEGEKWAKHRRILNPAFHHEKIKGQVVEIKNSRVCSVVTLLNICRFLPTKNNRRMREINRKIHKILREIIGKREKAIKNGETNNDDLLGLLLESNMRQSNGNAKLGLTTEDVIEECKLFYFAGMETTSVLLTWTLILLSMHPEWQERARQEVLTHFGRSRPDFDSLSRLKIVTMILYEVLRLYPPVVLLSRRTYKEMELGGIKYPAGVSLLLPIVFIHHDPNIWGKDASNFNPERFVDGISNAAKHQAAFLPFGGGPRICIGQNFALLEAKMALCTILQRFSFELSPSYTHAPYTVITLHPQHGAQIRLKKL
nr:unnamed protein product [Digitaria exilis]